MKLIKNKNYLFFVFYGITSILIGVFIRLNDPKDITYGFSQIIVGILLLAIGLYLSRKPVSEVVIDERIKKRDMKMYASSLTAVLIYVTFLALMDVLWSANLIDPGDFFLIFPRPDITLIFSRYMSIIGVAVISVAAFGIYYNKKGEA